MIDLFKDEKIITLHCPRCGKLSCLKKKDDDYKGIDVYICQEKDCGRQFAIEHLFKVIKI